MEKFIEKFTFYDILGYGLPGFLFLVIFFWIVYPCPAIIGLKSIITNEGIFVLAVLTFSHVLGSVFSDLRHFLKYLKWMKVENPLQEKVLVEAEKRSNIIDESDITAVGEQISDKEIRKMYGDLQADEKYNRIHNYGSVEVMCKNVSVALFYDALFAVLCGIISCNCPKIAACIPLIVFGGMMVHRAKRFERKKKEYTIIWFMEKYKNK